jgi:hypothetical protein
MQRDMQALGVSFGSAALQTSSVGESALARDCQVPCKLQWMPPAVRMLCE